MNPSDQITSVEPRIRIPAWRSASPKNRRTRPPNTSPKSRAANFAISPRLAIQSRGTASQPIIGYRRVDGGRRTEDGSGADGLAPSTVHRPPSAPKSLDHADFRVGREQRLREDVVER